jgi:signal transduction histidine kinase
VSSDAGARRLAELRRLAVLDVVGDRELDEVVKLAAEVCGVPVAMVTVHTDTEQKHAAKIGTTIAALSREQSFCSETLARGELLEVPDATVDPRFADLDVVTGDPGIRFYAGVPLISATGLVLGTVCVLDTQPRELDDTMRAALTALARHVVGEWEMRAESALIWDLAARAGEVDRLQDEFLALISHELRTPLTAIRGYLELLHGTDDQDPAAGRRMVEVIARNADRLVALIDNLLLTAQVSSGLDMQWADIDVAELLERVGKQFHGVAAERGLRCQMDTTGPIMVRGDGHRLTQAIDHLLFNALKVTPRGGLIRMSVAVGSRVVIEISDTGAGISASEQLRLFDAFYRTESSRTLQVPGAGPGLAIVKAVVVAHRGDVEVASSPGQGATFRISLPPLAVDELRS